MIMSRPYVITLRLPRDVGQGLQRQAIRTGHKPAYLGAMAVDEFVRRQTFPLIDFRETAAGRVAYVRGSRLAVYWLATGVRRLRGNIEKAALTWDLSPDKIRAALHYAETFPDEMKALQELADDNRNSLRRAEASIAQTSLTGRNLKLKRSKARR